MGYRSDVVILIHKEYLDEFEGLINEGDAWWDSKHPNYNSTDYCLYELLNRKWYDSYEHVASVTDFVNQLNKMNTLLETEGKNNSIAVLGEELGDYETIGVPWEFGIQPIQYMRY